MPPWPIKVVEFVDKVAPVVALGCTIVVPDEVAAQAAPLTDDPMVEAPIAARYPRVIDTLDEPPQSMAVLSS